MRFMKVLGPVRVDSNATGGGVPYHAKGAPGGRAARVAQYMVKVLQTSGTSARVSVDCDHGPDGEVWTPHSQPIAAVNPGTTFPGLVAGDADSTTILGEWIRGSVMVTDGVGSSPQWAVVEVYEMRKPF